MGRFSDLCDHGFGHFTAPLMVIWVGVSIIYLWQMFLAGLLLASDKVASQQCGAEITERMPTYEDGCVAFERDSIREVFIYSIAIFLHV